MNEKTGKPGHLAYKTNTPEKQSLTEILGLDQRLIGAMVQHMAGVNGHRPKPRRRVEAYEAYYNMKAYQLPLGI